MRPNPSPERDSSRISSACGSLSPLKITHGVANFRQISPVTREFFSLKGKIFFSFHCYKFHNLINHLFIIKLIKKDMQLKGDVCYFSSDTDDTRYPPSPKSCQLCFIIAPKSQLLHSSARAIGLAPRCTQRYCKTKGEAP